MFSSLGLMIMVRKDGEYVLADRIDVGVEGGLIQWPGPGQPIRQWSLVPLYRWGDANGDGRTDLVAYKDEKLTVFLQDAGGRFREQASKVSLSADAKPRLRTSMTFMVPPQIQDINGDGRLDAAFTEASKGRVRLYFGLPGRADFSEPEQREIADAWNVATEFVDLDGTGRRRLAMWMLHKLGLASGIDAFVSKRVTLVLYLFGTDGEGRPGASAASRLEVSVPYTIRLSTDIAEFPVMLQWEPNLEGDLNGDGRKDLITASGQALEVRFGHPEKMIEPEPGMKLTIHPPTGACRTRILARDLNGDGKSDLILTHADPQAVRARVEVRLSK
jgi:hypothetical protein